MTTPTAAVPVHVETKGAVAPGDIDYARTRVESVLRYVRDPVLFIRVRLTQLTDPALARPAVAQANLDRNGRLIRAQVARPSMREAIDEVHDRLRTQLQRAAGDWEAIRGARPTSEQHEWRHTSVPAERPSYFPRPLEDRQLIRHKAFSLGRMTVDEAAVDMSMLDYSFHLFTEDGSGMDSVLYRTDDSGFRLAQVEPRPDQVTIGQTAVTISPQPAILLTALEATDRLDAMGQPFVFFRDAESGRGGVVYHRYDGHYGLITPA